MLFALALLIGLVATTTPSRAQAPSPAWPQRTVKFIVPFGPGSATDIDARLFADRLAIRWGKSVVAVVLAMSLTDSLDARTLSELAALARARPGKLNAAAAQGLSDFMLSGFL